MRKLLFRVAVLVIAYWCFSSPDVLRAGSQCDPDCGLVGMVCCGNCGFTESGDMLICDSCC